MSRNYHKKRTKAEIIKDLKLFMYNPTTNEYMSRTPLRWGKLGLYYLLAYTFLASYSTVMYVTFDYGTLPTTIPKLIGDHSRTGGTPGVSMRPAPFKVPISSSTNTSYHEKIEPFVKSINKYLSKFSTPQNASNVISCNGATVLKKGQVCKLDMKEIFPPNSLCTYENNYGYFHGTPCVLLKVNKLYGWKPDLYKPDECPDDLPVDRYFSNKVSVYCFGAKPVDQQNLGTVMYIPPEGIDIKYFPYTNQKQYRSPFMWARFLNATVGTIINVKCKFFSKNIKIQHHVDIRYAGFQLLIE